MSSAGVCVFLDHMTSDLELLAALRADALRNSELAYRKLSASTHQFYVDSVLQHGLVPERFLHGVLIPIYKTGKDSSKANSYRPVTLSVTLTRNVHSRHMFGAPSATSCPVWVYITSRTRPHCHELPGEAIRTSKIKEVI